MISTKIIRTILLFSFITMMINYIFFGDMSVDFIFLFGNFLVIVICLFLMRLGALTVIALPPVLFEKKIFFWSLGVRIFTVFFLYFLFYYITGTKFDVEAIDQLWYHRVGLEVADLIRNGNFSLNKLVILSRGFDYIGYTSFLGIVYFLTNGSVISVRIIQAIVGAFSVVIIYRIGSEVWNDNSGKNCAIVAMAFQPLVIFDALHLRETFMVFFCLLFILQTFRIINVGFTLKKIVAMLAVLFVLSTLRTALFVVALLIFLSYAIFSLDTKIVRKLLFVICFFSAFLVLSNTVDQFDYVKNKSLGYFGFETDIKGGGRSIELYEKQGLNTAQIVSYPFLSILSLSAPFPSMVKTNIQFFNQTLQWYYVGGLMIYGYLMFFGYIGIYKTMKKLFQRQSILLFSLFFHSIILVVSVYVFSIRFNIIKMTVALLFIGIGLCHFNKKWYPFFTIYCVIITFLILAWNYAKLAGRGWI